MPEYTDKEIREQVLKPGGPECPLCRIPFGLDAPGLSDAEVLALGSALNTGGITFVIAVDDINTLGCPNCGIQLAPFATGPELYDVAASIGRLMSLEDIEEWARTQRDQGTLVLL